jgi:hypothetical protein
MAALSYLDLPPLYSDFDESSTTAQKRYLRTIVVDLIVLVLAAGVSSYTSANQHVQQWLYAIGAALLFAGLFVTIVLSRNAYEKTWYGGRAAAETVKSLAWKYMLRAAPFEGDAVSPTADSAFVTRLASVLRERRDLALSRTTVARAGQPITPRMRSTRQSHIQERISVYQEDRVQDQIRWYSDRSRDNERAQAIWLYGLIGVQAIAATSALIQVIRPGIAFNAAATLAGVATAMLAWSQIKRYRELAQSYSIAAHELGLAAALAVHVKTEAALSEFVNDTETAISREHTMWIARRESDQ